jgi:hypothetical protein
MKDEKHPAAKGDLAGVRRDMTALQVSVRKDVLDLERRLDVTFDMKLRKLKEEILLHFDVVAENMQSDIRAIGEPLKDHDRRIGRLETRAGITA